MENIKNYVDRIWCSRHKSDIERILKEYAQIKVNELNKSDVMRSAYFDIPNSEMAYTTYSTKAYFDEKGWFLIDCDGKKQYEDERWLKVSLHCA